MSTLRQIADRTGFHISVVSRALSRNPRQNARVADETRRIIEDTAQELGYRPNRAAEFLRRGGAATLGVFLPKVADGIVAELVFGLAEEASELGFPLNLAFGMTSDSYRRFITSSMDIAHCGIITYPFGEDARFTEDVRVSKVLGKFREAGGKVVVVNSQVTMEGVPMVCCDEFAGGRLAARRLLERGCKRFVQVAPYWGRTEGFRDTLREAGHEPRVVSAEPDGLAQLARVAGDATEAELPLGVFCTQRHIAYRAMTTLAASPLRVGREALLVGYDDDLGNAELSPPMTTVHQPFEEVGRVAVRKVVNLIYDRTETSRKIAPRLVVRGTA